MELSEELEQTVSEFLSPIRDAGYTFLPFEKSQGSLEAQLRHYLFSVAKEEEKERIERLWYGAEAELLKFSLHLTTVIGGKKVEFAFKGLVDPNRASAASLKGLEVKTGGYRAYYPFGFRDKLPTPLDAYQASLKTLLLINTKKPRTLIKKLFNRGRSL